MPSPPPPKGWHSRGYLPHFNSPGQIQALTFRFADSIPAKVVEAWRHELAGTPQNEAEIRKRISRYDDACHGACLLRIDQNAEAVESCLLYADGQRYRLLEWCIMPNHVHVMIEPMPTVTLGEIVKTWKTYSARVINQGLGREGALWAPDYHDRYIRDQEHYDSARVYIRLNPVKAGLCKEAKDWCWGSAFRGI